MILKTLWRDDLPPWARRDHPVMRLLLRPHDGAARSDRLRVRIARALTILIGIAALVGVGMISATNFFSVPAGATPIEVVFAIAGLPLVALGLAMSATAIAGTLGAVQDEVGRGRWDTLRTTPQGIAALLWARWAAVFWRVRPLLLGVLATRAFLCSWVAIDLFGFGGDYLGVIATGGGVGRIAALLLVSASMAGLLLLPISGLALDGAIGALFGTLLTGKTAINLAQAALIGLRSGAALLSVLALQGITNGTLTLDAGGAWATALSAIAIGDQGIGLLPLARTGALWSLIGGGAALSGAALGIVIVQVWLTERLLLVAARIAQRRPE